MEASKWLCHLLRGSNTSENWRSDVHIRFEPVRKPNKHGGELHAETQQRSPAQYMIKSSLAGCSARETCQFTQRFWISTIFLRFLSLAFSSSHLLGSMSLTKHHLKSLGGPAVSFFGTCKMSLYAPLGLHWFTPRNSPMHIIFVWNPESWQ